MDYLQARLFRGYFEDSIFSSCPTPFFIHYIEENHINSDEFMKEVPVGMLLLVGADKALIANIGKTDYACKQLWVLYIELGKAFFADNPNASEQGHSNFKKYMFMLYTYISRQLPEAFKDDDNEGKVDSKENDNKEETLEELLEQLNCLVGLIDVKKMFIVN